LSTLNVRKRIERESMYATKRTNAPQEFDPIGALPMKKEWLLHSLG